MLAKLKNYYCLLTGQYIILTRAGQYRILVTDYFELERLSTFYDALFGFLYHIRLEVGLLWTMVQLVAKASTKDNAAYKHKR
jgi:hypothetical protein